MKRKINVAFVGHGHSRELENMLVYRILARNYDLHSGGKPDYVVVRGGAMLRHVFYDDCIKILFNGENFVADFNAFDYAIGFDHIQFGDRYIRCPLFAMYESFGDLITKDGMLTDQQLLNRRFCSFVVSNGTCADPIRQKFFERLARYKKVDSGGGFMNNIGGKIKDKLDFCRGYKFNIAFENSASPGYTTEKIMEAYLAESLPIYFGNPTVETDFRLESMVRVKGEADIERAVEEVIRLDKDDSAYLAKCHERCFAVPDPKIYEVRLEHFLLNIFNQPIELARRRNRYGYQPVLQRKVNRLVGLGCRFSDLRARVGKIVRLGLG